MKPFSPKPLNSYFQILAVLALLSSCDGFTWLPKSEETEKVSSGKTKDGLVKTYRESGVLYSEINYVNGIKHGISKSYSKSGKLQFIIPYDSGRKHGVSKLHYEDGKVRRETAYVYGVKEGLRKNYWTNGNLSSSVSYKNDLLGNDLKEYMKSGEEKPKYENLKVWSVDNLKTTGEYKINVTFDKNAKRAEYFIGELKDGKYLDELSMIRIPIYNGVGQLTYTPPPGIFVMEKLNIVGKLKTTRGNFLIREKTFNLAIEGGIF